MMITAAKPHKIELTQIHLERNLRFTTSQADMRFVKDFAPLISLNFNILGDNTKKLAKMEKFTLLAKILHCRRQ